MEPRKYLTNRVYDEFSKSYIIFVIQIYLCIFDAHCYSRFYDATTVNNVRKSICHLSIDPIFIVSIFILAQDNENWYIKIVDCRHDIKYFLYVHFECFVNSKIVQVCSVRLCDSYLPLNINAHKLWMENEYSNIPLSHSSFLSLFFLLLLSCIVQHSDNSLQIMFSHQLELYFSIKLRKDAKIKMEIYMQNTQKSSILY